MPDFDDWIDAQLRNVPVPRQLHARIRRAGAGERENPAAPRAEQPGTDDPADCDRLGSDRLDATLFDDGRLDGALRDVDVPAGLHQRLRAIPREGRWPRPLWVPAARSYWAAAAVLLIVVGGSGYWLLRPGTVGPAEPILAANLPKSPLPERLAETPKRPVIEQEIVPYQGPVTIPLGDDPAPESPGLFNSMSGMANSLRQAYDTQRRTQTALGAADRFEPLPVLDVFERPRARGISPPLVRGYDLLFQLKHGEHPFVLPSAHSSLRVSRVPFNFHTTSYDQAARRIAAGRLPEANSVRVEDFLAAQTYPLPSSSSKVALEVAGCPSLLGEPGRQMLQLAIKGGPPAPARHQPTHLVVAVDLSSQMEASARLATVRRALARLSDYLAEADRITLLGFSDTATVLAESATRDELATLLASHRWTSLRGNANLTAAVRAAGQVVAPLPAEQARRVLLITGAHPPHEAERRQEVQDALHQLTRSAAPWRIVHLAPQAEESTWHELAKKAGGRAVPVASADELAETVHQHTTGSSSIVARAVSLRVAFNPKTVIGYRLLGHEAVTLTGDAADPVKIDLQADQVATCMYELWLKPDAEGDLGSTELVWHEPRNGVPRRQVQPIRRDRLHASFDASPAWLQQGVVAARTAEFLRGSYYVPNSRRLGQLLETANRADTSLFKSQDYRELVRLLEQAARLR